MVWITGVVWVAGALGLLAAQGGAPADRPAQRVGNAQKPPTVLFLCPHGAAKSVLASGYFQRAAQERGLNVRVESAGTEPDSEVSAAVASHLRRHGYAVPITKPRRLTARDLETADVVISIGCDLKGFPPPRGTLETWENVPAPSEDFARADEAIRRRVIALVDELIRQRDHPR